MVPKLKIFLMGKTKHRKMHERRSDENCTARKLTTHYVSMAECSLLWLMF